MDKSAALKLLEVYEKRILDCSEEVGLTKDNACEMLNGNPTNEYDSLAHAFTMLPRMRLMICSDVEKFCRWLGFVQAILWFENRYTVEELKDHNRAVFAGKTGVIFDNGHSPHSSEDEEGYGGK